MHDIFLILQLYASLTEDVCSIHQRSPEYTGNPAIITAALSVLIISAYLSAASAVYTSCLSPRAIRSEL